MATSRCPHCQASLPEPVVFCGTCGRRVEGWEGAPSGTGDLADGAAPTRRHEMNSDLRRAIAKSKDGEAPANGDDPAATQPIPSTTRSTAPSLQTSSDDDPSASMERAIRPGMPRVVKMLALTLGLGLITAGAVVFAYRKLHPPPPPRAEVLVNLDTPVEEALDLPAVPNPGDPAPRKTKRRRKATSPPTSPSVGSPSTSPKPSTPSPPVDVNGPATTPAASGKSPAAPPPSTPKPPAVDPNNLANLGSPDDEEAPPSEEDLREQAQVAAYADGIRFVLRAHRAQVVACYERAFKSEGVSPGGRVVVDWTISTDGKARNVHTTKNTSGQDGLGKCLEQRIVEWTFPQPPAGDFTTSYPFVFSAGS